MIYDDALRIELSHQDWAVIRAWAAEAFGEFGGNWDGFYNARQDVCVFFFANHEDATLFTLRWK